MKYTTLGNTGIEVSRICVGCMSYGKASEDFHQWTLGPAMVKHAIDLGVNFFDTANIYSFGTSEEYLGRALRNIGVPRDKVVLASKVFFNEGQLSRKAILREIDGTLSRLGTDYLDLYQIHRFDYGTPIEETMEALDSLVKAGKVRAIGASAMYGFQFHNMQICAERNGWTLFSTMQNHYNLMYREDERELISVFSAGGRSPDAPGLGERHSPLQYGQDHPQEVRRLQGERPGNHRAGSGSGRTPGSDHDGGSPCLDAGQGCCGSYRRRYQSASFRCRRAGGGPVTFKGGHRLSGGAL